MRSATSCSKTLIRSDWRRFWPVTFLYALLSFFIMPVGLWNAGSVEFLVGHEAIMVSSHRAFVMAQYAYSTTPVFAGINLFLGVGLAMVLFSYLMKPGSVGLMHALPITRTRQFLAHFGAGLSMLTAANVLTAVLSLAVELMMGAVDVRSLLVWLLG